MRSTEDPSRPGDRRPCRVGLPGARRRRLRPAAAVPGLGPARRDDGRRGAVAAQGQRRRPSGRGCWSPAPGRSCCRSRPRWPPRAPGSSGCTRRITRRGWLRHLPVLAGSRARLREAAGYLATLARHRVRVQQPIDGRRRPRHRPARGGHGRAPRPRTAAARRARRRIAVDVLAVGYGFSAQTELAARRRLPAAGDAPTRRSPSSPTSTRERRTRASSPPARSPASAAPSWPSPRAGSPARPWLGRPGSHRPRRATAHPGRPAPSSAALRRGDARGLPGARRPGSATSSPTRSCAGAKRSPWPRSTRRSSSAPATPAPLSCSRAPAWAGARAVNAATRRRASSPHRTGHPLDLASGADRPIATPVPLGLVADDRTVQSVTDRKEPADGPQALARSPRGDGDAVARQRRADLDAYATHISWLAEHGCHGVTPNGSLGEYQLLTDAQREAVVRAAVAAAPVRLQRHAGRRRVRRGAGASPHRGRRRGRLPGGHAAAAELLPGQRGRGGRRTTGPSPRSGCRSWPTTTRSTPRSI